MTANVTLQPIHAPVPHRIRQIVFAILVVTCVAGIANVFGRFEQLRHLAATYYHPYLIQDRSTQHGKYPESQTTNYRA